jgi:hypothetical protein
MRLTLDEYSKHFKMSKEMINSKLRAKKLNYIIENGTTYIIVTKISTDKDKRDAIIKEKTTKTQDVVQKTVAKPKTTVATVLALYQRENTHLKEKIIQLEAKIDKLIDDKEQMLRDERDKIESLYNAKDEQLKNILELINTKLMLEQKQQTIHEVETFEIKDNKTKEEAHIVELREYLKSLGLKPHQRKVIRKRFLAVYDSDVRVIKQNGKLYLDFSKYDYSDLLEY